MASDSIIAPCNFSKLQSRDRVLARNFSGWGGPGKLLSYWEQQIRHCCKRGECILDSIIREIANLTIMKVTVEKRRRTHLTGLLPSYWDTTIVNDSKVGIL